MTAKIIDGKAISRTIRTKCADCVDKLRHSCNVTPGLAVIIIGDNRASHIYVRNKVKAAEEVWLISRRFEFSSNVTPQEVLDLIDTLNTDPLIHGILVQLPSPPQFDIYSILHRMI